jgi:hypothetical protein
MAEGLLLWEEEFRGEEEFRQSGLILGRPDDSSTCGRLGQQECFVPTCVPSGLAVAAAHGITEHQQTKNIRKAKVSSTQVCGPTLLAVKGHLCLLTRLALGKRGPLKCDTATA